MNSRHILPFRPQQPPASSPDSEALASIAASLREIVTLMKAGQSDAAPKRMGESDAIAWLMARVQKTGDVPSLSEVSRLTGIRRRQLSEDRWPRFHEMYDRVTDLHRGQVHSGYSTLNENGQIDGVEAYDLGEDD